MESKQCNKRTVVMRTAFSAWLNEMANGAPLLALRAHKYSVAMQCRIIITVLYDSVKGEGRQGNYRSELIRSGHQSEAIIDNNTSSRIESHTRAAGGRPCRARRRDRVAAGTGPSRSTRGSGALRARAARVRA